MLSGNWYGIRALELGRGCTEGGAHFLFSKYLKAPYVTKYKSINRLTFSRIITTKNQMGLRSSLLRRVLFPSPIHYQSSIHYLYRV